MCVCIKTGKMILMSINVGVYECIQKPYGLKLNVRKSSRLRIAILKLKYSKLVVMMNFTTYKQINLSNYINIQ